MGSRDVVIGVAARRPEGLIKRLILVALLPVAAAVTFSEKADASYQVQYGAKVSFSSGLEPGEVLNVDDGQPLTVDQQGFPGMAVVNNPDGSSSEIGPIVETDIGCDDAGEVSAKVEYSGQALGGTMNIWVPNEGNAGGSWVTALTPGGVFVEMRRIDLPIEDIPEGAYPVRRVVDRARRVVEYDLQRGQFAEYVGYVIPAGAQDPTTVVDLPLGVRCNNLADRHLRILGSEARDRITVGSNSVRRTLSALTVDGRGGSDTAEAFWNQDDADLLGGAGNDLLNLFAHNNDTVTIDGGGGNDELRHGGGPSWTRLVGGSGNDEFDSVANHRHLEVDDGSGNDEIDVALARSTQIGLSRDGADSAAVSYGNEEGDTPVLDATVDLGGDSSDSFGLNTFVESSANEVTLNRNSDNAHPEITGRAHISLNRSTLASYDIELDGRVPLYLWQGRVATSNTVTVTGSGPNLVHMTGGFGIDRFFGSDGPETMLGGPNNDVLSGGAGSDELQGQEGTDIILGGSGSDTLRGGEDRDLVLAGDGTHDDVSCGELRDENDANDFASVDDQDLMSSADRSRVFGSCESWALWDPSHPDVLDRLDRSQPAGAGSVSPATTDPATLGGQIAALKIGYVGRATLRGRKLTARVRCEEGVDLCQQASIKVAFGAKTLAEKKAKLKSGKTVKVVFKLKKRAAKKLARAFKKKPRAAKKRNGLAGRVLALTTTLPNGTQSSELGVKVKKTKKKRRSR